MSKPGIIERLRSQHDGMLPKGEYAFVTKKEIAELMSAIDALRAERDEARRMLCEEWAKQDGLPLDWQGRRGAEGMAEFVKWDCFKENTNV